MPEPSDLLAMLILSIIGLVLMLYPCFVPAGPWIWLAGAVLTGLLCVFRG